MKSGIYKIYNRITEKFYIGSAVNFKARWIAHKSALNRNDHKNKVLQASWNLHGEEAFDFIILEYCERDKLFEREQFWLDTTNCCNRNIGYNLFPIAGSALGTKWTEERKIAARERMKNFRHTDEAKARMREIQSNRSADHGAKISAGKMGHKQSEKTKAKIAEGNRGKIRSPEHIAILSSANKGKILSKETRLKLRKLDKWPHDLGSNCKCKECMKKKSNNLAYRRSLNKEAQNVQA